MSIAELKEEAIRQFAIKIDAMEEESALKVVIDFLGGIKADDKGAVNLSRHYDAIRTRYSSVLQRLAQ